MGRTQKLRKSKMTRSSIAFFLAIVMTISLVIAVPAIDTNAAGEFVITSGVAHVQNDGDTNARFTLENGVKTLVLGTRGRSLRVERINVKTENTTGLSGNLQYRVHIQNIGWTGWIDAGTPAGTFGMSYRLEGIQCRLTGELANYYDVRYCAHIQNYGDDQGWVYNGALAGTEGESKRLEEIKIQIVKKGEISSTPSISYRVHRQDYGWEKTWSNDGKTAGTTGQSKRLEGITITVNDNQYNGGVIYNTHIQNIGWQGDVNDTSTWKSNGEMSGTSGKAYRLEAIQIKLTGELADNYDVYYRVHAQDVGWMGWAKNGEISGTSGGAKRLEAIQILLKKKSVAAPSDSYGGVSADTTDSYKVLEQKKTTTVSGNFDEDFANEVLRLCNIERAKVGVAPLTMATDVKDGPAKIRAKETVESFSHTRPNGTKCFTAFDEAGIKYSYAGENIACGQRSPQQVVNSWMNSEGHRKNILNPNYKEIGIACYISPNSNDRYKYYWVQMFLTR